MKKYDKENILKQYEESGKIMYQATLTGDYKSNNREGKKLVKIFKVFEDDRELARICIAELLQSDNVVVRSKAAAYCLALNDNVEVAQKVLTEIGSDEANGIKRKNSQIQNGDTP